MLRVRNAPFTAVALVLDFLGLIYITLPVRIAIAGYLALRRRWWHFAAFVRRHRAVGGRSSASSRGSTHGPPADGIARPRTSEASFPSGHAVAASVTVVAAVIRPRPFRAALRLGHRRPWPSRS